MDIVHRPSPGFKIKGKIHAGIKQKNREGRGLTAQLPAGKAAQDLSFTRGGRDELMLLPLLLLPLLLLPFCSFPFCSFPFEGKGDRRRKAAVDEVFECPH